MFVGHYSASLFAKSLDNRLPLWVLFLAVQFVDILWAIFVLVGVEKARIIPGFTKASPLDLYFMPYTHSLVAAIGWSVFAFLVYYFWNRKETRRKAFAASLVGLAVFSHWVLDLLVHVPDLGLYGDTNKIGFGLWNYPEIALPLEFLLLIGSVCLYMRATTATGLIGRYGMPLYAVLLMAIQLFSFFDTSPVTPSKFAVMALISYLAFAGGAFFLERFRD